MGPVWPRGGNGGPEEWGLNPNFNGGGEFSIFFIKPKGAIGEIRGGAAKERTLWAFWGAQAL